jgi:hypothetical protein
MGDAEQPFARVDDVNRGGPAGGRRGRYNGGYGWPRDDQLLARR